MKIIWTTIIFLSLSIFSFAQNEIWQTAVYADSDWRYISGSADIPNDWRELGFDDGSWSVGEGSIGYGDNDDATEIDQVISLFMRKNFTISDADKVIAGLFNADFDDSFVAYLNGVEIARANISGEFPEWNQDADGQREAQIYQGGEALNYIFEPAILINNLVDGDNVLSIQTHNRGGTSSSDLSSFYWLSFFVSEPLPGLGDFHLEEFQTELGTPLPIVNINTNGVPIPDEPKIDGQIGIVWNGDGNINDFTASANEYEGNIRIEKRGQSSLFVYPKNHYLFELVDENGEDKDASFLNFPAEEDFILHGPYSDKTLMRNVLVFDIANQMGQYASRTRFVELQINGLYEGIYVMMENIKRDKNRLDIAKLRAEDISGDELTGGYIFKIDKDTPDWLSQYDMVNNPGVKLHFQHVSPSDEDIMPEQRAYIKNYVDSFERAMFNPLVPVDGKYYHDFIDIESFVDHFLLVEFAKDVDAYRFSTYLHKDKDSNGGKLKCGPVWDFNISLGNGDFCSAWDPEGYIYYVHCGTGNPFWWNKLFQEPRFRDHAKCRWEELRETILHQDAIFALIEENRAILNPAVDRNFDRWPILGEYVWPNYYVTESFGSEINVLKQFIVDRLNWMDQNMIGICDSSTVITPSSDFEFKLSPNPTTGLLNLQFEYQIEGTFEFVIFDELGRELPISNQIYNEREIQLDVSHLPKGLYFLLLKNDAENQIPRKFIIAD